MIGGIAPYTKGNIVYNVLLATIWIIPTTLAATYLAPLTTGAAEITKYPRKQCSGWNTRQLLGRGRQSSHVVAGPYIQSDVTEFIEDGKNCSYPAICLIKTNFL